MNYKENLMRFVKLVAIAAVVLVMALAVAVPALAAQNATFISIVPNPAECYVDVTFQVEDAGPYFVTVYDDGVLLTGAGGNFGAGEVVTVRFTIGGPDGSPGVAIGIRESLLSPDAYTFVNDEFWTDPEGTACADAGFTFGAFVLGGGGTADCPNPQPSDATVRNVPAGAPAYHSPSLDAYTGFDIPAGTWYVLDVEGDFSLLWIACEASSVYIPDANVGG
jgi:hypothetical protein